jgi:hypothetical protein
MIQTKKHERGIYPSKNGHFKARIARNGRQHTQTFPTIEEAREFIATMEGVLGAPVFRQKQFDDWKAEYERQLAALPRGTDMTGVYYRKTGIHVTLTRQGVAYYVGHYHNLRMALDARDRKKLKLSAASPSGRPKTRLS